MSFKLLPCGSCCKLAQHSIVAHGTADPPRAAQLSTTQNTVQCNTAQDSPIQLSTVQRRYKQKSMHCTVYSVMQHNHLNKFREEVLSE